MKKRGQIDSHMFVYILTVLIVGIVIFVGYKFIAQSKSTVNKAEVLQLKNRLTFDIASVGKEFEKFKKITYALPENLDEVCFVDLTKESDALSSKLMDFYPIIKDNIQSQAGDNLFFFSSGSQQSYSIQNFEINHYPYLHCFKRQEGKITLGLRGLGQGKTLLIADFLTKANVNSRSAVVLQSADGVITLEIPPNTNANNKEISIEMVEPVPGTRSAASDIYKFEPSGTQFSQPIRLRIKYSPDLVGGCPDSLFFSQFNDERTDSYTVESKSIDCDNNVAVFEIGKFI